MDAILASIKDPGTVIVAIVGLVGTIFTAWYQTRKAHLGQAALLEASHSREDELRERQYKESEKGDRLLVLEYVDQIFPRLSEITSIFFLAGGPINKNDEERRTFERLQHYLNASTLDPAHPERTLGLRLAFLLFQVLAAMRLALNARWTRFLSTTQTKFLEHYEKDLEPILCSGRYPGEEFLYREQIEIIADEMLASKQLGVSRPLNWSEFCQKYEDGGVLRDLADLVAGKFRFVFDDSDPRTTPARRATQCRLAILSLYLLQLSEEAGDIHWSWRKDAIWRVVCTWFAWLRDDGQSPRWFVHERGDVEKKVAELGL